MPRAVALPGEDAERLPRQNDRPMEFTSKRYEFRNKDADYASLAAELNGLLAGEQDLIANAANTSALLFDALPDINWAGFYFLRSGELVLGPFQGKVACVRIALGSGVCGTAAQRRDAVIVPDVHAFPGHIACDTASKSEIVVPLVSDDSHILGVLDVDSPELDRFDAEDEAGLRAIGKIIAAKL